MRAAVVAAGDRDAAGHTFRVVNKKLWSGEQRGQ